MGGNDVILPDPGPDTAPYWAAAAAGEFWLRHCPDCGRWHHPRISRCCENVAIEWRLASGEGTLLSYAVVRLALQPELAAAVPYTIVQTRTAEGPLLVTALAGDGCALQIGMAMRVTFERLSDAVGLPRFGPVE